MTARIDPFITHCLAMMFGIAAYFTAPIDPPSLLLPLPENPVAAAFGLAAACGGLLAVYLYVWAHRHLHIGHPLALRGLLLLIAVFFGFIYAHGFTLVQARALAPLPAQVNSVETAPRLFRGRIIWVEPRPNGGLHVLRSGRRAYEIGLWQRTHGHGGDDTQIEDAPCSESVCFYPLMDGRQFAYVRAGRGLSEACSKADLVLAPFIEARYPCRAFLVDRRHLTKGRAVTVMQAQSGYEIVEPARAGRRIWQAYYRPRPDDG